MSPKNIPIWIALIGLSLGAAGCSNMTSPARDHALQPGTAYWFDYDASRRGAIFVPDGSNIKTCSEPSPDVALNFANQILLQVQTIPGSTPANGTAQAQLNASVVELAGRTETISFLRESLYRLCEQSINSMLNKDDVKSLYELAITAALKLAEADLNKNQTALAEALKDPEVRRLWEKTHLSTEPVVPSPNH